MPRFFRVLRLFILMTWFKNLFRSPGIQTNKVYLLHTLHSNKHSLFTLQINFTLNFLIILHVAFFVIQ